MNSATIRTAAATLASHCGTVHNHPVADWSRALCATILRQAGYTGRSHLALSNAALESVGV